MLISPPKALNSYTRKIIYVLLGVFIGAPLFASAALSLIYQVFQGGTGQASFTSSQLLYGNGTAPLSSVATTTASCAGTASCSTFAVIGSSPVTITGSGGGGASFPFTPLAWGNSTTSVLGFPGFVSTASSTIVGALHATGGLIGALQGNADTATALAANGTNCSAGSAPLGVDASGSAEGCFDVWTEAENTAANYNARLSTTTLGLFDKGYFFSTTSADWWGSQKGYLTGNQSITLSGVVTGTGATAIVTSFGTVAHNTVLANPTGGTAAPSFIATSSLGLLASTSIQAQSPLSFNASTGVFSISTVGTWSGNSGTATALAANGTNCSAGNYPLGVDASGNVESCTAATTGTVTSIATTWPLAGGTITTTGTLTWAGLATSSNLSTAQLLYATGVNTIAGVATSTLTPSAPLTGSFTVVGSGGSLGCTTADTSHSGCLTATDWNTFNNKGSGTLTAVSVATANGFAGSSSGGATPALTITTTITGLLKGNGTAISAASLGSDYVNGSGSSGHCVQWGSSNSLADAGSACGGSGSTPGGIQGAVQYNNNSAFAGANDFFLTAAGNAGIGSSSPFALLSVSATSTGWLNEPLFVVASSTSGTATTTLVQISAPNVNSDILDILSLSNVPLFNVGATGSTGVGTSSPFGLFAIHALNGQANTTLFVIASSTQSATTTLFSISNTGTIITNYASGILHSVAGIISSALVSLTSDVTGILPVANGGTNASSIGPGLTNAGSVLAQNENRSFSVATSTVWMGTTTISLGVGYGEQWNNIKCFTNTGTLAVDFYHASTHFAFIKSASTTIGINNMSGATNTTGDKVNVDIGTPASSPTVISCTVSDTN